jgi:hypothetical protein
VRNSPWPTWIVISSGALGAGLKRVGCNQKSCALAEATTKNAIARPKTPRMVRSDPMNS